MYNNDHQGSAHEASYSISNADPTLSGLGAMMTKYPAGEQQSFTSLMNPMSGIALGREISTASATNMSYHASLAHAPSVNPQITASSTYDQLVSVNRQPEPIIETKVDTNPITPQERPKLQNIVSTVNLGCSLNLKEIVLKARNSEYNPRRFAAVIMRIREPKTTALIFASGKMVCTGAKSEENSKIAARKFAKIIRKIGFKAKFHEFTIQNIVASCDVGFKIRLESLSQGHTQLCKYEPEIFPGLIYELMEKKIVLLIFVSGKIVLTGAKTKEGIEEGFDMIFPVLWQHRRPTEPRQMEELQ